MIAKNWKPTFLQKDQLWSFILLRHQHFESFFFVSESQEMHHKRIEWMRDMPFFYNVGEKGKLLIFFHTNFI